MKKIIVFLLLFSAINLHAQQWMQGIDKQKKTKGEVSFYDIQKAFNKYWEGKDIKKKSVIKGKGYKPFKRWEAFMIPRVYPSGILPAGKTWDAIQKKKKLKVYTKAQANWTHLGPDDVPLDNYNDPSGAGRINCVAYHPTDANIIYTGSPSGGFWKSTNGGADWATTTDELASIGISDIVVHPENPSTIFVATGDGDAGDTYSIGVLKSTDGGANWESAGLDWNTNNYVRIRRLLINPDNADTLIAATNAGIYRTADGGSNWSNVQSGHYKDLEFEPGNPEVVYAARYGSSNAKTYKSTDGGVSFTEITPAALDIDDVYRLELAVTPANSSYIYALYCLSSDNGFHSLWQSTDNGANWATVTTSADINLLGWDTDGSDDGGQGWYDLTLAVSPSEADEVYVGGVNLWKTTDAGTTWNLNGHWYGGGGAPYVHADHHYLGYSPSGVLFNGNDGGLYKTSNGGTLWTDISDGLHILQIDRMGISQSNDYVSLVGNQDNGTMKGTSTSWTQIYGGDGCECIVDFTDADVVYASYIRGDIKRSTTGGSGWVTIKPSGADDGAWHTPYIMDYNDNRTLYAGYSDVYKTTDRGDNWTKISTDLTGGDNLNQMAVAPSNSDYLYVTTGTGMWKTSDGGDNWSTVDLTDIGSSYVTYIAISYSNPENIWISVSGYSDGNKVFYSSNSGTDWTNFSTGLPNVPTNCIVYQKESNDLLYVGTDIGVYYREATMTEWADYGQGLPNVVISELEIQYSAEKLRAGSRGRGLWESGIVESSANVPLVSSATTSTDGSKIEVTFTKEMKDPTGKHAEFSVNNGATIAPDAAVLKSGDAYTIVLDLPSNILFGETVTVSYTEGSVEATNDEKLASFTDNLARRPQALTVANLRLLSQKK
ncbi:MAG: hypothetical protein B6I20_10495 [Bacteroidetes bacterium 4572_117]|nr:MAG: hypothetical protein B6I20_10495 [Bacteroidetes bacterium 4572_117]